MSKKCLWKNYHHGENLLFGLTAKNHIEHLGGSVGDSQWNQITYLNQYMNIARTHTGAEITLPNKVHHQGLGSHMRSDFQVLMMHQVGKCAIFTRALVHAFIPWPIRNIKTAMQKSRFLAHPFSAWIVSWSWDNKVLGAQMKGWWVFIVWAVASPTAWNF